MTIRTNSACFFLSVLVALSCANPTQAAEHEGHSASGQASIPADLSVNAPVASLLAKGIVVIPFKSNDVKIVPLYGDAAAQVVPRLGHLHVTLDGASWHWVHADDGPVVIQGLPSGPHQLTLELADAAHRILTIRKVEFTVP
jgi:hypothetical protein